MSSISVAPSSSDGVAIRYVFPVLWIASYLHIMSHMHGCRCNTGTASLKVQLGLARPWAAAEPASRKPVGPYDVSYCKPGAESAVCD